MSSEPKVGPESDTDSMAEYGDGDTGRFDSILFERYNTYFFFVGDFFFFFFVQRV